MSTEIDWSTEIEAAVPDGPGSLDRHAVLASGRRALRRRRTTLGASTLAVALLLGGVAWAVAPGDGVRSSRGADVTTEPTSGPAPSVPTADPAPDGKEGDRRGKGPVRFLGNPAALTLQGRLALAPGTSEVLEKVENPMGYRGEGHSLAIRAVFRGREQYSLMVAHPSPSGGGTSTNTVEATGDFAGWLVGAKASQHSLDVANGVVGSSIEELTADEWLRLDATGRLRPADPRVEVVEVREGVDLGDEEASVAVLEVSGQTNFVVVRTVGGELLEVVPGGDGYADLQAFIDHARRQYAAGTGLR